MKSYVRNPLLVYLVTLPFICLFLQSVFADDEKKEEKKATSIFNGKNLHGFKPTKRAFKVEKGEIVAEDEDPGEPGAYLLWKKTPSIDFGFSVKVIIDEMLKPKSRFYVEHTVGIAFGYRNPQDTYGFEIDYNGNFSTGEYYSKKKKEFGIYGLRSSIDRRLTEWTEIRLEVKGKYFRAFINGKKMHSFMKLRDDFKRGKIGIFLCNCRARFKDLNLYSLTLTDEEFMEDHINYTRSERHYKQANDFLIENKYDEAIKSYSESIKWNSKLAKAYHYRGVTYLKKKSKKKAIMDFEKVIQIGDNALNEEGEKDKSSEDLVKEATEYLNKLKDK